MAIPAPTLRQRFFSANGEPLAGGKLYSYAAGTTTPLATYTDYGGTVANANPIILDANGECNLWLGLSSYKFNLKDSADVDQWTVDNVGSSDVVNLGTADLLQNLGIVCTVASSAMTISLRTAAGAVPSQNDPVKVGFRSSTVSSGLNSLVNVTYDASTVISSGSTAGHGSGSPYNLYVYLINNNGTVEVAWSSALYDEASVVSTTAEGGAGGADSQSLMYSTTARTNVAFRLVGRIVSNQVTAGTWDTPPTIIQTGIGTKTPTQNVSPSFQVKSTTYTALVSDGFISGSTASPWTLSLFTAAGNAGKTLVVKKTSSDTNPLTIDPFGTETIDGKTSIALIGQNEAVRLISDGQNWIIDAVTMSSGLSSTGTLNSKGNNSNWEDAGNLVLYPGEYIFSANLFMKVSGGATTLGEINVGISTTSGNSATGLQEGTNRNAAYLSNADGSQATASIVGYRVSVSSVTTYYVKMKKENAGANLQYAYNFTAQRIAF